MAEPAFAPDTAAGLDGLKPGADGRTVWGVLGRSGRLAGAYRGEDPRAGVNPRALGALLTDVDAAVAVGSTLAVCVQAATALPLLACGASSVETSPTASAAREALAGDAVIALAATDMTAGSDLTALQTTVTAEDDLIEVRGAKRWIANATQADHILVLARRRPGRHFTSFAWVLVPITAPGVHVEPADTDLFDGSGTGHVRLDGVRLSRDHLVGRTARGLMDFAAHIAVERLAGALWGVALCRRVLTETKRLLEQRQVDDAPLWQMVDIRRRVANCLVRVRQLHALTRELSDRVTLRHDGMAAAMLKASTAATLDHVLGECAHLQGAEGFTTGGAQQLRAQAALWGIGGGTTEVVLSIVGDHVDALLAELSP